MARHSSLQAGNTEDPGLLRQRNMDMAGDMLSGWRLRRDAEITRDRNSTLRCKYVSLPSHFQTTGGGGEEKTTLLPPNPPLDSNDWRAHDPPSISLRPRACLQIRGNPASPFHAPVSPQGRRSHGRRDLPAHAQVSGCERWRRLRREGGNARGI